MSGLLAAAVWPVSSPGAIDGVHAALQQRSGQRLLVVRKWQHGYIDKSGKAVIEPRFEYAEQFSEGLAVVREAGRYGYVDAAGRLAIPVRFDGAKGFSEDLAAVEVATRCGYIDKTGEFVIPPRYEWAGPFSGGLARVKSQGKFGFIDPSGKEVIAPRLELAADFAQGRARFRQDGEWGFVDAKGQVAVKPQYDDAGDFSEGLAAVLKDQKWGYIDLTGKTAVAHRYGDAGRFSEGLAPVSVPQADQKSKTPAFQWGFIDPTGRVVVEPRFIVAGPFSEGLAPAMDWVEVKEKTYSFGRKQKNRWGYIDKTGKWAIQPCFDWALDFRDGVAWVYPDGESSGYYLGEYRRYGENWGYIDRSGRFLWAPEPMNRRDYQVLDPKTVHAWGERPPFVGDEPQGPRQPEFAAQPTVRQGPNGAEIAFAVRSETDVAVEVLNGKGEVVRHLAAGVLGRKAPAPLKPDALEQTLIWDGLDDHGRRLAKGRYTVRVALGMEPRFERVLAWSPHSAFKSPIGFTVDEKGILCAMFLGQHRHHSPGMLYIFAFGREGGYLHQVMPFPANLSREQVAGAGALPAGQDGWMPAYQNAAVHTMYPYLSPITPKYPGAPFQTPVVARDGKLLMVGFYAGWPITEERLVLLRLGRDGSAGEDFVGPTIARACMGGHNGYSTPRLALSPDGKFVYAAGIVGETVKVNPTLVHHVVYRGLAGGADPFQIYLGAYGKPGDGEGQLNDPRGLACDADGNLYVCEHGADRISVYSPEARRLATIPCKRPQAIAVHPRTGAIYVRGGGRLVKYRSLKDPREVADLAYNGGDQIALDVSADPPTLWTLPSKTPVHRLDGKTVKGYTARDLMPVRDLGDRLEMDLTARAPQPAQEWSLPWEPSYLSVDRRSDLLYAFSGPYQGHYNHRWLIDGATGGYLGPLDGGPFTKYSPLFNLGEETLSPDGTFLLHQGGKGEMFRIDARQRGGVIPFEATARDTVEPPAPGSWGAVSPSSYWPESIWQKLFTWHQRVRGAAVANNADLYVAHHNHKPKWHDLAVSEVSRDGIVRRYAFIRADANGAGVRVDRKGNVYVGYSVHPRGEGRELPFFRGKLPKLEGQEIPLRHYLGALGSVVKFGPKGGRIVVDLQAKDGLYGLLCGTKGGVARIEGVEWIFYGFSPVPSTYCSCESARFDLDGHDRLFVPESLRSSVAVLDSAGNLVCRFGRYGNMDSRGPGSPVPSPEIALTWPCTVAVSDRAAYVGDFTNFRIVKVRLDYAKERSLQVELR